MLKEQQLKILFKYDKSIDFLKSGGYIALFGAMKKYKPLNCVLSLYPHKSKSDDKVLAK